MLASFPEDLGCKLARLRMNRTRGAARQDVPAQAYPDKSGLLEGGRLGDSEDTRQN